MEVSPKSKHITKSPQKLHVATGKSTSDLHKQLKHEADKKTDKKSPAKNIDKTPKKVDDEKKIVKSDIVQKIANIKR